MHAGGELNGVRVLRPETVKAMTSDQVTAALLPLKYNPNIGAYVWCSINRGERRAHIIHGTRTPCCVDECLLHTERERHPCGLSPHDGWPLMTIYANRPPPQNKKQTVMRDITFGYGVGIQIPYTDDGKGKQASEQPALAHAPHRTAQCMTIDRDPRLPFPHTHPSPYNPPHTHTPSLRPSSHAHPPTPPPYIHEYTPKHVA